MRGRTFHSGAAYRIAYIPNTRNSPEEQAKEVRVIHPGGYDLRLERLQNPPQFAYSTKRSRSEAHVQTVHRGAQGSYFVCHRSLRKQADDKVFDIRPGCRPNEVVQHKLRAPYVQPRYDVCDFQ